VLGLPGGFLVQQQQAANGYIELDALQQKQFCREEPFKSIGIQAGEYQAGFPILNWN
jgi:hypothetical protein